MFLHLLKVYFHSALCLCFEWINSFSCLSFSLLENRFIFPVFFFFIYLFFKVLVFMDFVFPQEMLFTWEIKFKNRTTEKKPSKFSCVFWVETFLLGNFFSLFSWFIVLSSFYCHVKQKQRMLYCLMSSFDVLSFFYGWLFFLVVFKSHSIYSGY